MIANVLKRWPLIRQLTGLANGDGRESMSAATRALSTRTSDAEVTRSICPYCGVGCGQLVFHRNNRLLAIEGDPDSPISEGNLCPKGAASHQLLTHDRRETRVKYRAAYSDRWELIDLERAMDMIADRVWESRDRNFEETREGQTLMQCRSMAHLGGATLDNEENYLIKKMFTGGLGLVNISNQARI